MIHRKTEFPDKRKSKAEGILDHGQKGSEIDGSDFR